MAPSSARDTPGQTGDIVVMPVVVLARSFPARPTALPEVEEFLRGALTGSPLDPAQQQALRAATREALLVAAGPPPGSFDVVVRLFPGEAEVEILSAERRAGGGAPPGGPDAGSAPDPHPVAGPLGGAVRGGAVGGAPDPAGPFAGGSFAGDSFAGGSFADWLAQALRRDGVSQQDAARLLGVSVRTIGRWVRGHSEPRLREVQRIHRTFGPLPPTS